MTVDISHLPKYMQRRPEIRALTLRVYPGEGPSHFRVPGESNIYDVYLIQDAYHCGCQAGSRGAMCAHVMAVKNFRVQKEQQ